MKYCRLLVFALLWQLLGVSPKNICAQQLDSLSTQVLFSMTLDELMDVNIVSATQTEQSLLEAPSVMSIITKEQLREGQYRSVAEALEFVAGLDVLTDHFQPNIGIRGVNGGLRSYSRLMKVMIDNQPVTFSYNANNYLGPSLIPITAIEKIEIIRGPNSAIYGENAFLGVINIITKQNAANYNGTYQHSVGSIAKNSNYQLSTSLFTEGKYLDVHLSAQVGKYDLAGLNPIDIPNRETQSVATTNGEHSPTSFLLKMKHENPVLGKLIFSTHTQIIDSYCEFCDWSPLTHNNRLSFHNAQHRIRWSKSINKQLTTEATIGYQMGFPRNVEKLDSDSDPNNWIVREGRHDGWILSAIAKYYLGENNTFNLGIDFNYDDYEIFRFYTENTNGSRSLNPGGTKEQVDFQNIGFHAQSIFHPGSTFNMGWLTPLTITAGLRYDIHNIYADVFNYRLAGVYKISSKLSAKLMFGTSFNPPSAYQLYTNPITPGGIVGNPALKPEKAQTIEFAIQGRVGNKHYFQGTLFSTRIKNKVEFLLPYGVTQNITAANVSQINAPGLELEWTYYWKHIRTSASYSFQHAMVEKTTPLFGDIRIATDLYPKHQFKVKELIEWESIQSSFLAEGKFISQRIASETNSFYNNPTSYHIDRYKLDAYVLINLTFTNKSLELIRNKPTYLSLKIKNLFNSSYSYPGFIGYDIPGLERSFYFVFQQYF